MSLAHLESIRHLLNFLGISLTHVFLFYQSFDLLTPIILSNQRIRGPEGHGFPDPLPFRSPGK